MDICSCNLDRQPSVDGGHPLPGMLARVRDAAKSRPNEAGLKPESGEKKAHEPAGTESGRVSLLYRVRQLGSRLGIRAVSYCSTAAIVTSMALVMGLDAAMASRSAIISALLVIAIADNLTDSLSIHIYQESEALESRKAFITTLANYAARLLVSFSFLPIVLLPVSATMVMTCAIAWGMLLLSVITFALARKRNTAVIPELAKHLAIALLAILASRLIGTYISHILN